MKATIRFGLLWATVGALVLCAGGRARAQSYSRARIVRLSFVEGTVAIARPDLRQWAVAYVNTPIQEGFQLSTAENSFAEVEFEDASTARIGQLTRLEFNQLALAPSGAKVSRITIDQGYATFHVTPQGTDIYEITSGDRALTVSAHTASVFRIDLDGSAMRVEVFQGSVGISNIFGARTLGQNKVLELRPGSSQPEKESGGITRDAWDEWVAAREKQFVPLQNRHVPGIYSNNVTDLFYGWNDLWNYGTWSFIPGYSSAVWIPRVSRGWAPYTVGRWCWYSGAGYTWISGEPWGWLPYHYGGWIFKPGIGWCWIPGTLGAWSPALVTWYEGPDWIGWSPLSPNPWVGGPSGCPPGERCHTFIKADTFTNGRPVTPSSTIAVAPSQVLEVATPDISSTRFTRVPDPGAPDVIARPATRGASQPVPPTGNLNGLIGASPPADTSTEPGVVFDPADRRFVNAPAAGSLVGQPAPSAGSRRVAAPHSIWSSSDLEGVDELSLRAIDVQEREGFRGRRVPRGLATAADSMEPGAGGTPGIHHEGRPLSAPPSAIAPAPAASSSSAWGTSSNSAPAAAPAPSPGGATSHGGAFGASAPRETPNAEAPNSGGRRSQQD